MQTNNMKSINAQILCSLSTSSIKAFYDGEEALVLTEEEFDGEPVYLLTRGIQEFSDENASVGSIFWFHNEFDVFLTLENAINMFERITK